MKVCSRCGVVKAVSEFPARRRAKDGKASWCRTCFSDSWQKRYYNNHEQYKQKHSESRNRLRAEKARRVYDYLKQHPCVDCGEPDPIVLEFDQKPGFVKLEAITQMVINNSSWDIIIAEIQKCDVRCANCHRRKTAAHFSYKRFVFSGRQ